MAKTSKNAKTASKRKVARIFNGQKIKPLIMMNPLGGKITCGDDTFTAHKTRLVQLDNGSLLQGTDKKFVRWDRIASKIEQA